MSIFDMKEKDKKETSDDLKKAILEMDINHMTPIQALEELFKLKDRAESME